MFTIAGNFRKVISKIFSSVFELVFPEDEKYLALKEIDFKELADRAEVRVFENCFYLFRYKENRMIKDLMWSFKFSGKKEFADFFGEVIQKNLAEIVEANKKIVHSNRGSDRNLNQNSSRDSNRDNFILIPMPIHKRRRQERGFNQAELICQQIYREAKAKAKKYFDLSYRDDILIRQKYTQKQSWSSAKTRQENLKGAFGVREKFRSAIIGKKIILVDDVVTTGSTIREARRTLSESGASLVIAIVIAH